MGRCHRNFAGDIRINKTCCPIGETGRKGETMTKQEIIMNFVNRAETTRELYTFTDFLHDMVTNNVLDLEDWLEAIDSIRERIGEIARLEAQKEYDERRP